jgi:acetoin utilization deacetylase AcuC-like enzyme
MANVALAVERARARGLCERVAVLDWDVHHGNGTEAIYAADPDVLTVSIHQERNYPLDTGAFETDAVANLNVPLPPGSGHATYLAAMERLALPAIRAHRPDVIVIACGFDAAPFDPLGRMLATAETFRAMTRAVLDLADEVCGGRVAMAHEGGYSKVYVPFCGHAVIAEMAGSTVTAPDPFAEAFAHRQPGPAFDAFASGLIDAMAAAR